MTELQQPLSHEDQLVFVHIPKTAGLTLRAILANHFHCEDFYPKPNDGLAVLGSSIEELTQYRLFNGHYVYSIGERLRHPRYITMLRDPVSRMLSLFGYVVSNPTTLLHEVIISRHMTLEEFLEHPVMSKAHSNWQTGFIASIPLDELASVHRRYSTPDFEHDRTLPSLYPNLGIDVARTRLREFAMFGLCERFEESLLLLTYTFGWKPTTSYQSFNIASKPRNRSELPSAVVDRILDLNANDVDLYEFGKKLFDERFNQMCEELMELHGEARHLGLPLPLPCYMVEELLGKHYRQRWRRDHSTTSRSFVWDMATPVVGNGWHPAERRSSGGYARWTGPDTTSTMEAPLQSGVDYAVEFHVCHVIAEDILESTELRANGTRITLEVEELKDSGTLSYRGIVSQEIVGDSGDPLILRWSVARTGLARELDPTNLDPRRLGIMVCGVRIEPLP